MNCLLILINSTGEISKMAQLVPGIGAVVGLVINYQLIEKLGKTAMNAYRMRKAASFELQAASSFLKT